SLCFGGPYQINSAKGGFLKWRRGVNLKRFIHPACQFELSEGRKKQAETWETILFPIHIDQFLFTVSKNKIHPVEKADEYWKNIEELRRINSADFSPFNKDKINTKKFKDSVDLIIAQLKL
ncbi:hypothetical protein ACQKK3_16545, partial [Pedobacter suwonensis]